MSTNLNQRTAWRWPVRLRAFINGAARSDRPPIHKWTPLDDANPTMQLTMRYLVAHDGFEGSVAELREAVRETCPSGQRFMFARNDADMVRQLNRLRGVLFQTKGWGYRPDEFTVDDAVVIFRRKPRKAKVA